MRELHGVTILAPVSRRAPNFGTWADKPRLPLAHHNIDRISVGMFALHTAVIAYVLLGWMIETRFTLLIYVLVLPLIMFQWLVNHGSSVVNNWENKLRSGHWHDPANAWEGNLF